MNDPISVELVVFDPEDVETFPSVCAHPEEVKDRFGFEGGETLVFSAEGAYLGELTKMLPAPEKESLKPSPRAAAELMVLAEEDVLEADDAMGATDCPDGCVVEPDGRCSHGWLSAGITAGVI